MKEIVPACAFCFEPAEPAFEPTAPGPVCESCAEFVANAFWLARAGRFLTFETASPVVSAKAKISAALRKSVYERDAYRCVTCQSHIDLTLDHIYPESLGGETTEANLQTMCRPCNLRKGARV